jgi:hypothetical protein
VQQWLDKQTATIVSGTHVAPRDAQLTVEQWCDLWTEGYEVNRESTVRQARVHIAQIVAEFGGMPLSAAPVSGEGVGREATGCRDGGELRLRAAFSAVADRLGRRS